MEPAAKRPRLGISPYNNNRDEVDGDELNLQPEQVNALRDPGYQLERSRAVAANRLKSAFERIFEKYEKDFTGIGDEINLETGEVEVDNGHIQSLEDAILGDEDEEEDGDDSDSMDEEERLLQGKASNEKRLSCVGESGSSPLKSLIQPLGNSQPWPADPPRISSMFGPPRPPLGSFSTEYQIPSDIDTLVDPTWKAPQLPVVETYVDPAWKAPDLPRPKPATPRLPALKKKKLLTTRSGDQEDDDILTGASTTPMTKLKGPASVKKAKKLSPSHTQGSDTVGPGTVSKSTSRQKENKTPQSKKSTGMSKSTAKKPDTTSLVKPSATSGSKPKECTQTKEKPRIHTDPVSNKQLIAVKSKKSSHVLPTKRKEPGGHSEPEIYMYISSGKTIATKPQYQKLSVDIVMRGKIDTSLYQVVPTEPSDDRAKAAPTESQKEDVTQRPADVPAEGNAPTKEEGKRGRKRKSAGQKVYKRNVVDSSFVFSDDEDPALPKPKISKQPPTRPREMEQSPLRTVTSDVPRLEAVSTEDGVGSALNEESRESETGKEKTDAIADQKTSGEAEAPEPMTEEVYTRNDIDSRFTFSDEEDSALPEARVKTGTLKTMNALHRPTSIAEPVPTSVAVLSTTPAEPNAEGLTVPQASANEQPAQDEIHELSAQETVTEDPVIAPDSNEPSNEVGDNGSAVANIERDAPLAPVESPKSSPAPEHNLEADQLPVTEPEASPQVKSKTQIGSSEPNLEHNEPPAETDTVQPSGLAPRIDSSEPNPEKTEPPAETDTAQQPELTPHISSSEPTVAEPSEIVEEPPVRLLQMKPRRKRKISMALTEESMPSPMGPEGDKPTETFITAPSKRLKRSRLSYSVNASELGGQQEDQTVQLDPEPVAINDITIPETSPPPAPASVEFTIPESSPLIQPAFNSSLMGIVEDLVQLDDAPEPASDMDFDDTPSHPTPMPDLPSPDLGEDAPVPETSPLPYSSPSKAVKAVKKPKPKVKPPPQPSTPVNRKKKQKAKEKKLSISPAPSSGSKGLLSLIPDGDDDENELETDELSLTPRPRYYTPPSVRQSISQQDPAYTDRNKHTSLTAPLLRMKLLSSSKKAGIAGIRNNPKTPSHSQNLRRTLMAPVVNNNNNENAKPMPSSSSSTTSRMYFSADRRPSTLASSSGGTGVKRRRQSSGAVVGAARQHTSGATPRVPRFVQQQEEEDMVLTTTPGGTKRRCGEDGFHCDRDFCFVCL
ncbi:hypothetical protein V8F33_002799 [Rhypophila sp. PSN 637]